MGGHIHLPYVLPLHAAYKDLPRRMWAVQAGTSLSSRVRGAVPNSVNLIEYDCDDASAAGGRRAVIARWDFNNELLSFEPVTRHELDFDTETLDAPVAALS